MMSADQTGVALERLPESSLRRCVGFCPPPAGSNRLVTSCKCICKRQRGIFDWTGHSGHIASKVGNRLVEYFFWILDRCRSGLVVPITACVAAGPKTLLGPAGRMIGRVFLAAASGRFSTAACRRRQRLARFEVAHVMAWMAQGWHGFVVVLYWSLGVRACDDVGRLARSTA